MIDYRTLLKKYIDHVGTQEGIDFLSPGYSPNPGEILTKEEFDELVRLSEEVCKEYYK
jgi:hypothetical protein